MIDPDREMLERVGTGIALARLDERLKLVQQDMTRMSSEVTTLRLELLANYITRVEFWPVRAIVFGGAGVILVAVFSALVYLVVKGGTQ